MDPFIKPSGWNEILQNRTWNGWVQKFVILGVLILSGGVAALGTQERLLQALFLVCGGVGVVLVLQRPVIGLFGVLVGAFFTPYTGPGGLNLAILGAAAVTGVWIADMLIRERRLKFAEPRTTFAVVTSFVVTLFQQPVYQTQTTLVVGRMLYEANPSSNDIYLGQQLVNYYAEIGMRGDVYNSTQTALGLTWLPEYTISPLPNSQLMEIVVVDSNPARAQAVANELANQIILRSPTANEAGDSDQQSFINEQVSYLEEKIRDTLDEIDAAELLLSQVNSAQQIADAQEEIAALQNKLYQLQSNYAALISNTGEGAINTLSVIERAPLPTTPVGPNKFVTILIAGFVAAMIAAVAAYILELVDDTLKSPEEITELLAIPVLGTISNMAHEGEAGKSPSPTPVHAVLQRIEGILKSIKKPDLTSDP